MNRKLFIESKKLTLHEKLLNKIFNKKDSLMIFDIGACEGESSIRYKRMFPNAIIHLFEPIHNNVVLINNNIKEYGVSGFKVNQLCLSNKEGFADFYVSSGNPNPNEEIDWDYGNKSSSLLAPNKTLEVHKWLDFKEKIQVKTSTLSKYCIDNKIDTIDFIHMDVQGAELMVLEGAKDKINHINAIWLEVENVELYKNQPVKKDIQNYLLKNNFIKILDTTNKIAGDQFWINKNIYIQNKIKHNIIKLKNYIILFLVNIANTAKVIYIKLLNKKEY